MRQVVSIHLRRAERRAAPKPAPHWHEKAPGLLVSAFGPSGDRPTYPAGEGLS